MDDDKIAELHNEAFGHALYAAVVAEMAFHAAVSPDKAPEFLDHALLILERMRGLIPAPGAIDYARSRLEALLSANLPPHPGSSSA